MGCVCGVEYPPNQEGDPPDMYDERWDRYRFADICKGSDGYSAEEPSAKSRKWQFRIDSWKARIAFRSRKLNRGHIKVANEYTDREPRVLNNTDNDQNKHLSPIEKEKIRQWMNSINTAETQRHDISTSFCRSRVSLQTIYTQDDVELIRSGSHTEGMADPMRLTDTAQMSRLQGHLERQRRARGNARKSTTHSTTMPRTSNVQASHANSNQPASQAPSQALPNDHELGIEMEEDPDADSLEGSPRVAKSSRLSSASWGMGGGSLSRQHSPLSVRTASPTRNLKHSPSKNDLQPIREEYERLRNSMKLT